jgi:hypothetical protein
MKTIQELELLIEDWADEKDLIDLENALKQADKTQEELDELKFNLKLRKLGVRNYINEKDEPRDVKEQIKDDIGDIIVTLMIQCKIQETSFIECLNIAWEQIKDRKGQTINGTFIRQ